MSDTEKEPATIHPLTPQRHGNMGWHRFTHYGFARSTVVAPLAAAEVLTAALSLPLAFLRQGETWQFVAVLGLLPGQNLFAEPDGRWSAGYVPAALRSFPFRVGQAADNREAVLCIDEASGLLVENGGEAFFNSDGTLSKPVADLWNFMLQVAKGSAQLTTACASFAQANVIEPWPITIDDGGKGRKVEGLHRICEERWNSLDDETFLRLRQAGILPLAFAQMFSTGHIGKLGELVKAHQRHAAAAETERQKAVTARSNPSGGLGFGDTLDVDWSRFGN